MKPSRRGRNGKVRNRIPLGSASAGQRNACASDFIGVQLRPRVRNVLGKTADPLLAKRLARQSIEIVSMIVEKECIPRPVVNRFLVPGSLYTFRKEKVPNRSAPWEHSAMLACLRRLKREQFPFVPGFFRDERNARAWVSGIVAFKLKGALYPFQEYLGRMSNSSWTFTRTLPRNLIRQFVGLCVKGLVEYVNIFGSINDRVTQSDPLLRMAATACGGEINPPNRNQIWFRKEKKHHVIVMATDGNIFPFSYPIKVQGLGTLYDPVNGFDNDLC
jgi:hypothetical protein